MRFPIDSTSRNSTHQRQKPAQRSKRRVSGRAVVRNAIEQLEQRQLMTNVSAGQVGIFQGPGGTPVRVIVNGKGTFTFVGGSLDENGNPRLNDIPMTIYDANGNVVRRNLGGYGGFDGIEPITNITRNALGDSRLVGDAPFVFAPSGSTAVEGIGTNSRGHTYGVNLAANPVGSSLDIIGIDSTNGRVQLKENVTAKVLAALNAITPNFTSRDLERVIGADFDPLDDDTLFFALDVDFPFDNGTSITRKVVPAMFTYNIRNGTLGLDPAFFGVTSNNDTFRVDDFTFMDPLPGATQSQIAFFGSIQFGAAGGGGGGGQPQVGLFFADKTDVRPSFFIPVAFPPTTPTGNPTPVTSIAAIEFIPGENHFIAVDSRGNTTAQLLRIELNGSARRIGAAVDPEPADAQTRLGGNIGDLSFNARVPDQFFQPGSRGVLLGVDVVFDQLVGFDIRERVANTGLYAIFGNGTDSSTQLAVTQSVIDGGDDPFEVRLFNGGLTPFGGSAGSIATNMVTGNPLPRIIGLGTTGGVYLGVRTRDRSGAQTIPVVTLNSTTQRIGSSPGTRLPQNVNPGVYVNGSVGDLYVAGTITGKVNVTGSVDNFYAGNILTGDFLNGIELQSDNFYVAGDLRNLVASGDVGTLTGAPNTVLPGTDFAVGGRVQMLKVDGTFKGGLDVVGKTNELTYGGATSEQETVVAGDAVNAAFGQFLLANQPFLRNDSFDAPQVLGSYYNKSRRRSGQVVVEGTLNNNSPVPDALDTYAMPLLAGQSMVVQVVSRPLPTNPLPLPVYVQVMDPSGRIYATDESNQNELTFLNQAFQVTADKPGLWRIVVTPYAPTVLSNSARPYTLSVDKVGEMAIGGLVTGGDVTFSSPLVALRARNADLGAIRAGGVLEALSTDIGTGREPRYGNPIQAERGNIRSLEGSTISRITGNAPGNIPNVLASGSVGLMRAGSDLYVNFTGLTLSSLQPSRNVAIGGDYQVVEAPGEFSGVLAANGGIGVIRVGAMATRTNVGFPGYFAINLDGRGTAEIGLIDVVGGVGNFTSGGPAMFVGQGGNIRYFRAGGDVYRDRNFGAGVTEVFRSTNRAINLVDDTGNRVSIRPITGVFTGIDTVPGGTGTPTPGGIPDPFGSTVPGGNGTDTTTGGNGTGNPATIPDPFGTGVLPDPFGATVGGGTGTDTTDGGDGDGTAVPLESEVEGRLRVSAYPLRSGGRLIYNVQSSTGVAIATSRRGGGGSVDITTINTNGQGTAIVNVPQPSTLAGSNGDDEVFDQEDFGIASGRTLDVMITGVGRVNVYEIGGNGQAGGPALPLDATNSTLPNGQSFTRIMNLTDGEIVNVNAASIGLLEAEWLGVARPANGVKIEALNNVADARFPNVATSYPFNQAKNMIFLGDAMDVVARGPIGNIVSNGTIQNLVANYGNRNVKGVQEGIVAPIVVEGGTRFVTRTTTTVDPLTGLATTDTVTTEIFDTIRRIDIGEGLASNGSGETSFGGIYSNRGLGRITNRNGGGDLRGDVAAGTAIERITLGGGGSIIDADIYVNNSLGLAPGTGATTAGVLSGYQVLLESFRVAVNASGNTNESDFPVGIGRIDITGNGGVLNSRLGALNIGKLTVAPGGYGVINSDFTSVAGGTMGGLDAGGLGIRNTIYSGGSFIGDVIARGGGEVLSVDNFSTSARPSEKFYIDPATGITPNTANDLNLLLGTTKKIRKIEGVTNSGVLQDSTIQSNQSLRSVQAFEIRGVNTSGLRPRDETYPMAINSAESIGTITTKRNINGARVVSGTIERIEAGRDMLQLQVQTTANIGQVIAKRNILGTTNFNLVNTGSIDLLQADQNLNGTVFAARGIRAIVVGGNLGSAKDQGGIFSGANINVFDVGGDILPNAYVESTRTIKSLVIDGDVERDATVKASAFGTQDIKGTVRGQIVRA